MTDNTEALLQSLIEKAKEKNIPTREAAPVVAQSVSSPASTPTPPVVVEKSPVSLPGYAPVGADPEKIKEAEQMMSAPGAYMESALRKSKKEEESVKDSFQRLTSLLNLSNDDRDLILMQGAYSNLPNIKNKLQEVKDQYDKRVEEMGKSRAIASMAALLGHLAVGMYGVKHGVDTSGVKFDTVDWASEYKQIMDNYKMSADLEKSMYDTQMSRREKLIDMLRHTKVREEDVAARQLGVELDVAKEKGRSAAALGELTLRAEQSKDKEVEEFKKAVTLKAMEADAALKKADKTQERKTQESLLKSIAAGVGSAKTVTQRAEKYSVISGYLEIPTYEEHKKAAGFSGKFLVDKTAAEYVAKANEALKKKQEEFYGETYGNKQAPALEAPVSLKRIPTLHGREIITQGGRWVYKDTGLPVESK